MIKTTGLYSAARTDAHGNALICATERSSRLRSSKLLALPREPRSCRGRLRSRGQFDANTPPQAALLASHRPNFMNERGGRRFRRRLGAHGIGLGGSAPRSIFNRIEKALAAARAALGEYRRAMAHG